LFHRVRFLLKRKIRDLSLLPEKKQDYQEKKNNGYKKTKPDLLRLPVQLGS